MRRKGKEKCLYALRTADAHQRGHSEDLDGQRGDEYTPVLIIIDEGLLQNIVILEDQRNSS